MWMLYLPTGQTATHPWRVSGSARPAVRATNQWKGQKGSCLLFFSLFCTEHAKNDRLQTSPFALGRKCQGPMLACLEQFEIIDLSRRVKAQENKRRKCSTGRYFNCSCLKLHFIYDNGEKQGGCSRQGNVFNYSKTFVWQVLSISFTQVPVQMHCVVLCVVFQKFHCNVWNGITCPRDT